MKRHKHTPPSSYSSKTRSHRIKSLNLNIPDHYRRCEICRSTFKCPKVLPCMHVFCLRCLQLCWRLENDGREGGREGRRGSGGGIMNSSERDSGLGLSGGTTSGKDRFLMTVIVNVCFLLFFFFFFALYCCIYKFHCKRLTSMINVICAICYLRF